MSPTGFYVYAIARTGHPLPQRVEGVDGSTNVASLEAGGLAAIYTPVDLVEFSQPVIDARSKDVEWLGGIGYRHQAVMAALMHGGTIVPLRAFTLFSTADALRAHLIHDAVQFEEILSRVDGKQEWTLRIEFDAQRWNDALASRVESLRSLVEEIGRATTGRAFLLRKKLDDEKKRASREAEQQVVAEIESAVLAKLNCATVAESRQQRGGAFPQLNVLLERDEEAVLQELQSELGARYESEGITLALTGPWPPYTFAVRGTDG
ncbi:MAG: gas vesicle protein GvpL/GvpF family [Acidobacteria bacterium]|nr:gas vesicle protein GvpL/GvpF family [Acidobacteriota bacterium]